MDLSALLLLAAFVEPAPITWQEPGGKAYVCEVQHPAMGIKVVARSRRGDADGFWAYAQFQNGWPTITFDDRVLSRLPTIVKRFTYYHECAHLQNPAGDENATSCAAVAAMRRAGDLSDREEATLAQRHQVIGRLPDRYGGSGIAHWQAAVDCADAQLRLHDG